MNGHYFAKTNIRDGGPPTLMQGEQFARAAQSAHR
jgi:hypothetical protein